MSRRSRDVTTLRTVETVETSTFDSARADAYNRTVRPLFHALAIVTLGVVAGGVAPADTPDAPEPTHDGKTLAAWIDELAAPAVERRRAAAFEMWSLRRELAPRAADIARTCADADPYVRTTVGKALESLGIRGAAAFPIVVRAFDPTLTPVRQELVVLALAIRPATVGPTEVARACTWLGHAQPLVRGFAVALIAGAGRTAPPEAKQALKKALSSDALDEGDAAAFRQALATIDPIGSLASDEHEQRLAAISALNEGGRIAPDVVRAVVTATTDQEDDIRAGAVVVLSTVLLFAAEPATRAVAAIGAVEAWKHAPIGSTRQYIPLCLARAARDYPPAFECLREALEATDEDVLTQALGGARELDPVPEVAVAVALRVLRTSSSPSLRQMAAYLLGMSSAGAVESVVPALAVAMFDLDAQVRRAAGEGLGRRASADPAVAALVRAAMAATPDTATEDGGLRALGAAGAGTREDEATARSVMTRGRHSDVRLRATELVLRWSWGGGEDARVALASAALSDDSIARSTATDIVVALSKAKRPVGPWIRTLLTAGASPRVQLRQALLLAATNDVDAPLAARLVELLLSLPDVTTSDENEVAPIVEGWLTSPDSTVRASAAIALRSLGFTAEHAAPALLKMVASDPDPLARGRPLPRWQCCVAAE